MTREEELELVVRVRSGDADAFEPLVIEHQKKVYNLAARMVGSEEDAKDLTQEAFIRAYNSIDGFRGESKFSVWLYRLTSNVCIDFLRSRARRRTVSLTNDDGQDMSESQIADESLSPDSVLERRELREAVLRGLGTLSDEYREILLLREINGLTYEEIGAALSLEEGTVKSRIFRARKKLCEYLVSSGNIDARPPSNRQKGGGK